MVMKKNKKLYFIVLILAVIACAGYFIWDGFSSKSENVSYKEFYDQVEKGNVTSVKIDGDKILFQLLDEKKWISTDNPSSPLLQEKLLLQGVSVKVEKDGTEILSIIFDIVFYVFFIGIIFFASKLL